MVNFVKRSKDTVTTGFNTVSKDIDNVFKRQSVSGYNTLNGIYRAKVIENADPNYDGSVTVQLVGHEYIGDTSSPEGRKLFHKIRRTSPFGGTVQGDNYSQNFGSAFPPPPIGTEVIVAFTGREQEGFMVGILNDTGRNGIIPGIPTSHIDGEEGPQAALDSGPGNAKSNERAKHPISKNIAEQGIALDAIRGPGSSGSRRESPSNVSGFLTPGGHGIIMDDGTVAAVDKDGDGNKKNYVPDKNREAGKSNLIRIRSGQGGQFLINDSAGIVYIINQNGSSWVQMDSDGNVDIYAQGNVSMHAEEDFNLHVGNAFNLEADTINMKTRGESGIKIESAAGGIDVHANKELRFTTDTNGHWKAAGDIRVSTDGMIDLNGPPATVAEKAEANNHTTNKTIKESISGRVPEHEPWGGHPEADTIVASQAPSTVQNSSKDIDFSDVTSTSGSGSGSSTSQSSNTNPRTGGPF